MRSTASTTCAAYQIPSTDGCISVPSAERGMRFIEQIRTPPGSKSWTLLLKSIADGAETSSPIGKTAMPKLFSLEPEVAGGWGPSTVVANRRQLEEGSETVPEVAFLEYRFDGWLGDGLLTSWPCFVVTEELAEALVRADMSGFRFESMAVTTSDVWEQFAPTPELPRFRRLVPEGQVTIRNGNSVISWSGHDICWGTRFDFIKPERVTQILDMPGPYCLVATDRCLDILKQHHIEHCDIAELVWPPHESKDALG